MAENMGFGFFVEIPCVVYDVQRVGPSTGLPTRTQQSDLLAVAHLSHGDTEFPMLFPWNPTEAFEFAWKSFDIADRYQIPTVLMLDLDLGMNYWVCDPLEYPDQPMDRGKVLTDEMLDKPEFQKWGRYLDIDGDGIPWRTVPGMNRHPRASYFTRGSGHNEYAEYTEDDETYTRAINRLHRKVASMVNDLPAPLVYGNEDADFGVIAYGTTHAAVEEALAERNGDIAYLRIRSYPLHSSVGEFLSRREGVLIVEQNQQGQMGRLIRQAFPQESASNVAARYFGGLPISADFVRRALQENFAHV